MGWMDGNVLLEPLFLSLCYSVHVFFFSASHYKMFPRVLFPNERRRDWEIETTATYEGMHTCLLIFSCIIHSHIHKSAFSRGVCKHGTLSTHSSRVYNRTLQSSLTAFFTVQRRAKETKETKEIGCIGGRRDGENVGIFCRRS